MNSLEALVDDWIRARQAVERLPRPRDDEPNFTPMLSGHWSEWLAANKVEVRLHQTLDHCMDSDIQALFQERGVPESASQNFFWRRRHWQEEYAERHGPSGHQCGATLYIPTAVFEWENAFHARLDPLLPAFVRATEERLTPLFHAVVTRNLTNARPNLLGVPTLNTLGWPDSPYIHWSQEEQAHRGIPEQGNTLHGCLVSLPLEAATAAELATLEDLARAIMDQIVKEDWGHFKYMGTATHRSDALEEASIGMGLLWARQVMGASASHRGDVELVISNGDPCRVSAAVRIKPMGDDQVVAMYNLSLHLQHRSNIPRVLAPWFSSAANHLSFQLSATQATELRSAPPSSRS